MVLDSNGWWWWCDDEMVMVMVMMMIWWWWWWWCSSISEVNDLLKVLEDLFDSLAIATKPGSLVVCLCSATRRQLLLIKVYRVPPPVAFASGRQYAKLGGWGKHQNIISKVYQENSSFWRVPKQDIYLTYPPQNGILKMIFLFPRWDMLIPWRVYNYRQFGYV